MYLFIRKVFFLVGLTLCVIFRVHSQVVTSTRDGLWSDPSIWSGGQVPTPVNASETVINHSVIIPGSGSFTIQNVVVNSRLTVETGATVNLIPDAFTSKWDLQVFGTLVLQDGATLNGTTLANTSFEAGSRYIHFQGPLGFIPYATWDKNSTFEIAGFRTQGYINIAHSDSWKQVFGNVVYNCPQQTTAFVDLNGYLRNITGNLIVQHTNNQALRLSTTQNSIISIGEDFIIEGPSRVWFCTNPTNGIINIQNNFKYRSASAGISYLTTQGTMAVTVQGAMEIDSPGRIHMASTSLDSTGVRQLTLNVGQHLTVTSGLIVAPPSPGKGKIIFNGTGIQTVVTSSTGGTFQGNLDFVVGVSATVSLGNSVLSNQSGTLTVRGKLQVGSLDPAGSIQLVNKGNLHIQNGRIFENGSTLEYNGAGPQFVGTGHPSSAGVNLICSNPTAISLLKSLAVNDFTLSTGRFDAQSFSLSIHGDVDIAEGIDLSPEQVLLTGSNNQSISAPGKTWSTLTINKTGNSAVTLLTPLRIAKSLLLQSSATTFHSNGNLTLLSTSDEASGTASVGPLPPGSMITGDVTVQRHMRGEGRIYRYISSPVSNATVASLMDDFPISGTFQNPSVGPGIQSKNPSFFYYDESRGGLQEGWIPYPATGLASANPLTIGKGYAAFIRNGSSSTTWDVTGPLNQGEIELPLTFTSNNQPSNGWNLLGNPYASAIQWDEQRPDAWTMENISSVIAIRDNGSAGGTFKYWDMDANYSEVPGGQIASGQSFWIRATAPTSTLIIREGVKVAGGATFFRKPQEAIPSFAISLSRDSLVDVAYFKIRPSAKAELDNWDGLKLDNDNFDLSFVSADNKSLAIHARDVIPCDEIIRIGVKDLNPGVYKLSLSAKYDFTRYKYTLRDIFLNTEQVITQEQPVELQVTAADASHAFDRFAMHVQEMPLKTDRLVDGPQVVCSGQVVNIVVKEAEAGVIYTAWNSEDKLLALGTSWAGGELVLKFLADSLTSGNNTIRIKAQTACQEVLLSSTISFQKVVAPTVFATSSVACSGSSARLTASSDRGDAIFTWFSEEDSRDTLAVSNVFDTPPLIKPNQFYVKASLPSGCSSERYPVKANILIYEPAKITLMEDAILSSNYTTKNTWYFNGVKMENETGQQLSLTLPGIYALEIDTLTCVSRDDFEYLLLSSETPGDESIFYPNPVQQDLFIPDPEHRIQRIEIYNLVGELLIEKDLSLDNSITHTVDVSCLRNGAYHVVLMERSRRRVIRFIKIID